MKRFHCKPLIWIGLGWIAMFGGTVVFGGAKEPVNAAASQIVRIVADLDGDHQPDIATARVEQSVIRIKIRLSSGHTRMLLSAPIDKQLGLRLTAYDVDDDSKLDLILTSTESNQPVAVWLNTSKGQFERIKGWVAPVILERESGSHFHRRVAQFPEQTVVGSVNPVPPIIVESNLLYKLDEDRQAVKEGLPLTQLRPAFTRYDRGPPLS